MKVVLFCGGLGMRLREYSDKIPKPLVPIGNRPMIWHIMKYYAHFGHNDFILCLGYKGEQIKDYFINYKETISSDFVLDSSGVQLLGSDISNWRITFVDTGIHSSIGERLRRVRRYVDGEEMFLANYSDGLCNADLNDTIDMFRTSANIASCLSVRPNVFYHFINSDRNGQVRSMADIKESNLWINGGYFCLRPEIFDYLHEGDELVVEGFQRLIELNKLAAPRFNGWWHCVDTFKELQQIEQLYDAGKAPWEMWRTNNPPRPEPVVVRRRLLEKVAATA